MHRIIVHKKCDFVNRIANICAPDAAKKIQYCIKNHRAEMLLCSVEGFYIIRLI